jgi:hypothetical protein
MLRASPLRHSLFALLFAAAATGTAHGRDDPHRRVAGQNGWLTNLKTAKEQAKKTGKPIMVVLRCFR